MPQDCVLCGFHLEDSHHILFNCPFTLDVAFVLSQDGVWPLILEVDRHYKIKNIFAFLRAMVSIDDICQLSIIWWYVCFLGRRLFFRMIMCPVSK